MAEMLDAKPFIDAAMQEIGAGLGDWPGLPDYLFGVLQRYRVRDELPPDDVASPAALVGYIETIAKAAEEIDDALAQIYLQRRSARSQGGARAAAIAELHDQVLIAAASSIIPPHIGRLVPAEQLAAVTPREDALFDDPWARGFARWAANVRRIASAMDTEQLRRPRKGRDVHFIRAIADLAVAFERVTGNKASAHASHPGPFVRFVQALWAVGINGEEPPSPKRVKDALDDARELVPSTVA